MPSPLMLAANYIFIFIESILDIYFTKTIFNLKLKKNANYLFIINNSIISTFALFTIKAAFKEESTSVLLNNILYFIIIVLNLKIFYRISIKKSLISVSLIFILATFTNIVSFSILYITGYKNFELFNEKMFVILGSINEFLLTFAVVSICYLKLFSNFSKVFKFRLFLKLLGYFLFAFILVIFDMSYFAKTQLGLKDSFAIIINLFVLCFLIYNLVFINKDLALNEKLVEELHQKNNELHNALEELKQTQDKLVQSERLASLGHLMGGVAHNLRTPLMTIAGFLDNIKHLANEYDSSIEDNQVNYSDHHEIAKEMLNSIEKTKPSLYYMDNVIKTVLQQAVNKNEDSEEKFKVSQVVEQIKLLMSAELNKSSCILQIEYDGVSEKELKGQLNLLIQVMNNLIINSIQAYEGKKGIIELYIEGQGDDIIFEVKDSAGGIPGDIRDMLFKQMATSKGKNGTGLGLYISYSVIRVHFGGDMWFESDTGQGTTFFVSIPAYNVIE